MTPARHLLPLLALACAPAGRAPDVVIDTGERATAQLSFEQDIAPLLARSCVGCHRTEDAAGSLALDQDPRGALVNQHSAQAPHMALVEPSDSLHSYLWHKLQGSQSVAGGSGTTMPLGTLLPQSEIDLVQDWIDAGCP